MKKSVNKKISFSNYNKDSRKSSWKIIGFVTFILVVLLLYFYSAGRNDPKNLIPSEKALTGKAIYGSPLTALQLKQGVVLDKGFNILVWTNDIEELPITEAFASILDNVNYVYDYNSRTFWFNPNGIYARYITHPYYKDRLFTIVKPGHKYYVPMKNKDVLTYNIQLSTTIILPDGRKIVPDENQPVICVNRNDTVLQSNCYDVDGITFHVKSSAHASGKGESFDYCGSDGKTLYEAVCVYADKSYTSTSSYITRDCNIDGRICKDGACVKSDECVVVASETKEINEGSSKIINGLTVYVNNADETNSWLSTTIKTGNYLFDLNSSYPTKEITLNNAVYKFELISATDTSATIKVTLKSCPTSATCTDSDGGFNPNIYGWTYFKSGSFELKHEDACALVLGYDDNGKPNGWQGVDSCSGNNCYVEEAYCLMDEKGNVIDADADELIKCPNGCKDGACVTDNCALLTNDIKNNVTALLQNGNKVILNEGEVIKYRDYVLVNSNGNVRLLRLNYVKNVSSGFSQDNVEFLDLLTGNLIRTTWTSEGYGDVSIGGTNGVVKFLGDSSISIDDYRVTLNMHPLDKVEGFGSCFSTSSGGGGGGGVGSCIDTDGGIVQDAFGMIKSSLIGSSLYSDSCTGSTLKEYYCLANNSAAYSEISCVNGCNGGVCLRGGVCGNGIVEAENIETCDDGNTVNGDGCSDKCRYEKNPGNSTCVDSDNGLNKWTYGFVNLSNGMAFYDKCVSNSTLYEVECDANKGGVIDAELVFCQKDCVNGACLKFQCNDGLDNDGDGKIDFLSDPECNNYNDDSEAS